MSLKPAFRSSHTTPASGRPVARAAALVLAATFCAQPLMAAECKQANAVYSDRDGAYELRFTPIASAAAAASNRFTVKVLKTPLTLDGYVMPSEDPARSLAMVMFKCPDGDATGADLEACTIWQGMVYGIDAKGSLDNLQPEAGQAADKILFPGIGPAIRASSIWGKGKASVAPWDVLDFKECAS
jgi:hypothetical protein